jgi:hypothetical protein
VIARHPGRVTACRHHIGWHARTVAAPAAQEDDSGMTTAYTPPGGDRGGLDYSYYDDSHGQGLVTFAGVMIMIAGVLNTLYGIAAIDKANVFVHDARYVFLDLSTWGWFVLALGVAQIFAALAIWRGTSWGRWFGIACASVNVVLQVLWMPSYPILALTILPLDILAIWGLLWYGGRRRSYREAQARADVGTAA